MKQSTSGSGGQRSRSHEAEYRFGHLAQASFSTPLGQVAVLVITRSTLQPAAGYCLGARQMCVCLSICRLSVGPAVSYQVGGQY